MPASASGPTTHHSVSVGTKARQAVPAATSSEPAAARPAGAPRMRAPATAASGSTETTTAAASGSTLQPVTSRSTVRKITAVSAAETSASASPARTTSAPWGRRPPSATRGRAARTNAGRASSTSGACTRKIARQPSDLGDGAAERGPGRGAQQRGRAPLRTAVGGAVGQQRERGREHRRPARGLHAAQDEQQRQRRDQAAAQRGQREHDHADAAHAPGGTRGQVPGGGQGEPEHERVDGEDRGHAGHRRVQGEQERWQGQRHDPGVGQREARDSGDGVALVAAHARKGRRPPSDLSRAA